MKILRHTFLPNATIGTWLIDGKAFCFTLEDVVRPPGVFVPKATAIPAGEATIELSHSPKFHRPLPHIYGHAIPPERGIRVHRGVDQDWTDGCVLVGFAARLDLGAELAEGEEAELKLVRLLDRLPGKKTMIEIVELHHG